MQLKYIYYHVSGNKEICQGICKFEIIGKQKICCVWVNGQEFGCFEESMCQSMLFDTNTWTYYRKGAFASMFRQ